MRVTQENIKTIKYIYDYHNVENGKNILDSLLIDLEELNNELDNKGESYKKLYIDYEDKHTEYSPERTDPCPDYYGTFTLRFENKPYETVGEVMDLNELDTVLCALVNFIEFGK
jgi:hypothetical protein